MSCQRHQLIEQTPESWAVAAYEASPADTPGRWATHPWVVWTFQPRPRLKVAVRPASTADSEREAAGDYLVDVNNELQNRTHNVTGSGEMRAVEVAVQVMRGLYPDGVSPRDVRVQLQLSSGAANAIATRIRDWSDLAAVHREPDGFTNIDGIGATNSDRLKQALAGPFLNQERHAVARNPGESADDHVAVYAVLPCVDGWKVRKEWVQRHSDGREQIGSRVMLPVRQATGGRYGTLEAAKAAAATHAARQAGGPDGSPDAQEAAQRAASPSETQVRLDKWK